MFLFLFEKFLLPHPKNHATSHVKLKPKKCRFLITGIRDTHVLSRDTLYITLKINLMLVLWNEGMVLILIRHLIFYMPTYFYLYFFLRTCSLIELFYYMYNKSKDNGHLLRATKATIVWFITVMIGFYVFTALHMSHWIYESFLELNLEFHWTHLYYKPDICI